MTEATSCPGCRASINAGARFCAECGFRLSDTCTGCGSALSPGARFCASCGRAVAGAGAAGPPLDEPTLTAAEQGERRHITVVFCDLVDSTQLAEELDPEDLRTVIREFHSACSREVAIEDGHVAQYLGDGLLVFFGYPRAHEDDSQRAVRAALGIVEAVQRVGAEIERTLGVSLLLRIGINSGPVVVGEAGDTRHRETQALGVTMNLAARLQSIAPLNSVVMSEATKRLVNGLFVIHDLGSFELKGISQRVPAYQVLGLSGVRSRLELVGASGLTPLAGRRRELTTLAESWRQASGGSGHCVLLEGEAGIGKSRMVRMLREQIVDTDHTWIECRGAAQHVDSALYPVIDVIQRTLKFERNEPATDKIVKLEAELASVDFELAEAVPLFASLLSLPLPESYETLPLSPTVLRRRIMATLERWLVAHAQTRPAVLVVEDLHWIDPSTLELLDAVVEQVPNEKILFVATFRPSFESPWRSRPSLSHLVLEPLGAAEVSEMISDITHGKALPVEVARELVARTDGTPIFVEELTKMMLESEMLEEHEDRYELSGPLPPLAIPATLQDSLTARLDRLSPAKDVAQIAATIGRSFSYELLEAVAALPEKRLRDSLEQLVGAEILVQHGSSENPEYLFRHALIQEAAYGSLLRSRRQQSHSRIAEVMQEHFPEIGEMHPEILAHHLQHAGLNAAATGAWRSAGMRAIGRSAMVEAVRHFRHAIDLLRTQPADADRDRQELQLQAAISLPVIATAGYGTREAEEAITRARDLCDRLGEAPEHVPVLRGVWTFYEVRADYRAAFDVAEKLMALANAGDDPLLEVGALHSLGITNLFSGAFTTARDQLERAASLYDPERQKAAVSLTPMDPGVGAYGFGGLAMWFAGSPDTASRFTERTIPLSRQLGTPFNMSWALILAGWMDLFHGRWKSAHTRARAAVEISLEQGFGNSVALGSLIEGASQSQLNDLDGGLVRLREGLAGWRAVGTDMGRSHFLCWYADACLRAELIEEGLSAIGEGLAHAERTGEGLAEAELQRLRGELLLVDDGVEADRCLGRALEIADHLKSPSLQLRAATSLARRLQSKGQGDAARRRLEPIYDGFSEGFDSRDLQEAKRVLDAL